MNIRQISYNWENSAYNAFVLYVDIDENKLHKHTLSIDLLIHSDTNDLFDAVLRSDYQSKCCGIGNGGADLGFPSWEKIVEAFGIQYFCHTSIPVVDDIIKTAESTSYPVLCEALIDKDQFFEPKLSPKVMPDGALVSPSLEDMYPFLSNREMTDALRIRKD